MSKTATDERYPVFFVTNTGTVTDLWMATESDTPELFASVDKATCKLKLYREIPLIPLADSMLRLDELISHGLASSSSSPTHWTQFLTRGLYDPRLFAFFIRPFLAGK